MGNGRSSKRAARKGYLPGRLRSYSIAKHIDNVLVIIAVSLFLTISGAESTSSGGTGRMT